MPEPVDDPLFGPLQWDESLDWWVGSVDFLPGLRIDVFIVHEYDGATAQEELAQARRVFGRLKERELEYRRWSAAQLLWSRWNKHEPMTVDAITELLRVATLEVSPDGSASIYWNDDDELFYGHNVVTRLAPDGSCLEVGME
jgi:hypothetical protein